MRVVHVVLRKGEKETEEVTEWVREFVQSGVSRAKVLNIIQGEARRDIVIGTVDT